MKIEIKNMGTLNLIKGFLELYRDVCTADMHSETEHILRQMETVPSTDSEGNFIEDPRELCKAQWEEYEQEYKRDYMHSVTEKQERDNFFFLLRSVRHGSRLLCWLAVQTVL